MRQVTKNEVTSKKPDENEGKMGIMDAMLTSFGIIFPTCDVYSDICLAFGLIVPRCNVRDASK